MSLEQEPNQLSPLVFSAPIYALYLSPHFDRSSSNHDRSLLQPSQLFSFTYRAKCTFSDLAYRFLQKSSPSFFPHISSHRPQCTLSAIHSGQSFSNMCGSLYLNRAVQAIEYSGIFSLPSIKAIIFQNFITIKCTPSLVSFLKQVTIYIILITNQPLVSKCYFIWYRWATSHRPARLVHTQLQDRRESPESAIETSWFNEGAYTSETRSWSDHPTCGRSGAGHGSSLRPQGDEGSYQSFGELTSGWLTGYQGN